VNTAAVLLLLLAIGAGLWREHMRAREAAMAWCRRICSEHGVQLLDDTVCLRRMRLRWAAGGRPVVQRVYGFEFSRTGADRHMARIGMSGRELETIWLGDEPRGERTTSPP
jgi:hypothetical protein